MKWEVYIERYQNKRHTEFITYDMELQISYSVCTKVQKKSILWEKRLEIGWVLRQLCEWKGIGCPDHNHMLITIPPKYSVSSVRGFLKGKSDIQ